MMARVEIDLKGLEEVATSSEMRALMHDAAETMAENVRAQNIRVEGVPGDIALPVKVYDDVTKGLKVNRAVSRVVLAHASGQAVQAKHGALSKAASSAGLKLRGSRTTRR